MSVHPTIVPDVSPRQGARIGRNIPFPFFLQQLEPRRTSWLYGGGPDVTRFRRNTTVCLDLRWIGTVVGRQVIPILDSAVTVAEGEAIGSRCGASREEA